MPSQEEPPAQTQPWPAPTPRSVAGRYTLVREIGRGGMGSVWLANDRILGRTVAIKRIGMLPGGAAPDLQRAEREARLAAMLNHPHVVAVFDLVPDGDQQWLVMEYVEGFTLASLISAEGPLPPARVGPILLQATDALAAAHAAGIVHRDVKPSNILLTTEGQVKLTDFGIARAEADVTLTATGMVSGSPAYLAPEVASGSSATPESDVWSLGATLFHALAGRPPYDTTENVMGILFKIVHEEPPRLPNVGRFAPLLEATMAKDPSARWSMREVRDFLASDGHPVRRGDAPPPERTAVLTPPPAPSPAPTPAPTAALPPGPAPAETVTSYAPGRRRGLLAVGLAAVVVLLLALGAWRLLGDSGDPAESGGTPGDGQSQGSDTASSDPTPETEDGPTEEGMQQFVRDYLAAVTSDRRSAWAMLTDDFQRESGNYGSYNGFWRRIVSATPSNISADPSTLEVSYTADYELRRGGRDTDQVTLALSYADGTYLIADERD